MVFFCDWQKTLQDSHNSTGSNNRNNNSNNNNNNNNNGNHNKRDKPNDETDGDTDDSVYEEEESLEAKLKKYQLSRYIKEFESRGITKDRLMAMDEQAIKKLEDEIIPARAIFKHRKFEKFIREASIVGDYQSEYLKHNSNLNSVCFIFLVF